MPLSQIVVCVFMRCYFLESVCYFCFYHFTQIVLVSLGNWPFLQCFLMSLISLFISVNCCSIKELYAFQRMNQHRGTMYFGKYSFSKYSSTFPLFIAVAKPGFCFCSFRSNNRFIFERRASMLSLVSVPGPSKTFHPPQNDPVIAVAIAILKGFHHRLYLLCQRMRQLVLRNQCFGFAFSFSG